ncbi:MAG: RNA-splicing ligase RtcB, partial [Deltaproteobacteria bacterium]|nr:RNA-splicing ligase RtcB [Deltaproteobacteria bacterium]
MQKASLKRRDKYQWVIEKSGSMNADGVIFGSEKLIEEMDDMVATQVKNVASLPGI